MKVVKNIEITLPTVKDWCFRATGVLVFFHTYPPPPKYTRNSLAPFSQASIPLKPLCVSKNHNALKINGFKRKFNFKRCNTAQRKRKQAFQCLPLQRTATCLKLIALRLWETTKVPFKSNRNTLLWLGFLPFSVSFHAFKIHISFFYCEMLKWNSYIISNECNKHWFHRFRTLAQKATSSK